MWKPTVSSDELWHSAKGSHWKDHKYIRIDNGHYVYEYDNTADKKHKVSQNEDAHQRAIAKRRAERNDKNGLGKTVQSVYDDEIDEIERKEAAEKKKKQGPSLLDRGKQLVEQFVNDPIGTVASVHNAKYDMAKAVYDHSKMQVSAKEYEAQKKALAKSAADRAEANRKKYQDEQKEYERKKKALAKKAVNKANRHRYPNAKG